MIFPVIIIINDYRKIFFKFTKYRYSLYSYGLNMLKKYFASAILLFLFLPVTGLNAQQLKFAVLGDSQFQNRDVFKEILNKVELLKPGIVLHAGDMIHGYTYNTDAAKKQWVSFKKQISVLSAPFYGAPGNHDVTTKESQPAYVDAWGKERLYYSFSKENCHFIMLNTFLDQVIDSIPRQELDWLKQDLQTAASKGENIFITMHSPFQLGEKGKFVRFHDLIKNYNVKGVFTGHYHVYDYRVIDGIPYFCINSSGNMGYKNHLAGRSHNFLYVTVNGSKVDYAVVTQDNIYPPDAVTAEDRARAAAYFGPDKTIIIENPDTAGYTREITVPLENRTDSAIVCSLTWKTKDYRWNFYPAAMNIRLEPKSTRQIKFTVEAPAGRFSRQDLPSLWVSTPFSTLSGYKTECQMKYQLFYPPRLTAKKAGQEIKLDGKPDEDEWAKAPSINELYTDAENTPEKEKTRVSVLYDKDYIYVGIKGSEPNPKALSAMAYGDIPLVFADDDFEIYFDTKRDLVNFYRLMVNPAGTILNSGPKGRYTFKFDVKTFTGDDYWSAEFRIPYSEIKADVPVKGTQWGFNVRRHRQQSEHVQSDWSKMSEFPPYEPEHFGVLRFEE